MEPENELQEALETVTEAVQEAETALAETTTDNDVAIAAIEAQATVEVAAIEAEARVAVEESYNEARIAEAEARADNEGDVWQAIRQVSEQVQTLSTQIATLMTPVVVVEQPLSSSVEAEALETATETLEEMNTIQTSTIPTDEQTQTEHLESVPASADPIAEVAAVIARPIIQLV